MNKINAKFNIDTKTFNFNHQISDIPSSQINIGFNSNSPTTTFNDLSFGYEVREGEYIVQYKNFPFKRTKIISTTQEFLRQEISRLKSGRTYKLWVWVENGNDYFEEEFEFSIPMPEKPYESWI
jgi:hypothetical protein